MIKTKKITLIGGDTRQLRVLDFFKEKKFQIFAWGIEHKISSKDELAGLMIDTEIVILPLPVSKDGIRLNSPFCENAQIKLSELSKMLPENITIFGGKIPADFAESCNEKGIKIIDYFNDECLCIKNALLTAEAATEIAMRELPGTLDSSKSMVIGYGRIGKLLTNLLIKLNSEVTVAARRETDLAFAECMGAEILDISKNPVQSLLAINNGYDVVFNTVPTRIMDSEFLGKLNKHVCLIDLASPPGGIDIRAARENGMHVVWALSLPGKHSPKRAGSIIADTIFKLMKEEGLC